MDKYKIALYNLRLLERKYKFETTNQVAPQVWCDILEELVEKSHKLEKAYDKTCEKLAELDECLLIYKHYPDYIKRTMNKEEWKEWGFKDDE